jgi:hypothetical protein
MHAGFKTVYNNHPQQILIWGWYESLIQLNKRQDILMYCCKVCRNQNALHFVKCTHVLSSRLHKRPRSKQTAGKSHYLLQEIFRHFDYCWVDYKQIENASFFLSHGVNMKHTSHYVVISLQLNRHILYEVQHNRNTAYNMELKFHSAFNSEMQTK